ncbi:hypothetical protein HDU93_008230 [Gonapodya sp. JEL0774]|nr:hypothetical protein HDU93_008230 [Gonapodya sp. JEL0774]
MFESTFYWNDSQFLAAVTDISHGLDQVPSWKPPVVLTHTDKLITESADNVLFAFRIRSHADRLLEEAGFAKDQVNNQLDYAGRFMHYFLKTAPSINTLDIAHCFSKPIPLPDLNKILCSGPSTRLPGDDLARKVMLIDVPPLWLDRTKEFVRKVVADRPAGPLVLFAVEEGETPSEQNVATRQKGKDAVRRRRVQQKSSMQIDGSSLNDNCGVPPSYDAMDADLRQPELPMCLGEPFLGAVGVSPPFSQKQSGIPVKDHEVNVTEVIERVTTIHSASAPQRQGAPSTSQIRLPSESQPSLPTFAPDSGGKVPNSQLGSNFDPQYPTILYIAARCISFSAIAFYFYNRGSLISGSAICELITLNGQTKPENQSSVISEPSTSGTKEAYTHARDRMAPSMTFTETHTHLDRNFNFLRTFGDDLAQLRMRMEYTAFLESDKFMSDWTLTVYDIIKSLYSEEIARVDKDKPW